MEWSGIAGSLPLLMISRIGVGWILAVCRKLCSEFKGRLQTDDVREEQTYKIYIFKINTKNWKVKREHF
uniref:Secreted protein n=1 Tax=Heterorhabditis bacteriophora TaxID=37862 RepID=A0A1I7WR19_HETBA